MASSAALKHALRHAIRCKYSNYRQLSVFNEFSKQLKGQANSNSEFQQSVKELKEKIGSVNEKFGSVKEDIKVRTKQTAEKLYQSVDGVWMEAEAASKKVSSNVKEKISAAKEEAKEAFGIGKDGRTGHQNDSAPNTGYKSDDAYQNSAGGREAPGNETIFSRLKLTLSSASPAVSTAFQKLKETKVSSIAKQGYEMVKDELSSSTTKKRHMQQASSTTTGPRSTKTDVVVVPSKNTVFGEKWEAFKKKVQEHPAYKKLTGYTKPVVNMTSEFAEDVRERWETSDNPVVHKIQDLNETVFGENATASSVREIRRRDPNFNLPDFVAEVQEMISPVLNAYMKGDVETLKKYCTKEVIERCNGERNAYQSQGMFFDSKILHISEVDVRETKLLGSAPIIVLAFQTQQIYCIRDREGKITAGGEDTIQTVYYAWAMQQVDPEELGIESYFPVWRLREMQQLGVQALI